MTTLGNTPSAPSEIAAVTDRIVDANMRLTRISDCVGIIGDRVFGAIPPAPQGVSSGSIHPDGQLPMLHASIDILFGVLNHIEDQVERLSRL